MLRKFMDYQLSFVEKGKPLHFLRPLVTAGDTFLYEAPINTKGGPHIRDAIDIKRWMIMVVIALIPCILWAFWNTGLQAVVYSSGDFKLMENYLASTNSFSEYFAFVGKDNLWMAIFAKGFTILFPIILISYAVGGLVEALFAVVRGHEISEGFLVTGILYALILPPTIPWWMLAVGVAIGVIFAKEVFGGSGMNIVNPALACRAFLFFAYPGKMSGNVWVGSNPATVRDSLLKMNQDGGLGPLDGFSQATKLALFNVPPEIKRVHIDAIATNNLGDQVGTFETIKTQFAKWISAAEQTAASLGELTKEQMQNFVTTPFSEGGLGLSPGYYEDAYHFSNLNYGFGHNSDWSFIFGDRLGSMGSTSVLCILLGALFLIWTGIGSWRTMAGMFLGAFLTASIFQLASTYLTADYGSWTPAQFGFPAYKHLILGGLAFGAVFMATDPVSSPDMHSAKWIYGLFCGLVTVVIRVVNPAFPEGVMLAILMGNVFAPLFDYYAATYYRKRRISRVRTAAAA